MSSTLTQQTTKQTTRAIRIFDRKNIFHWLVDLSSTDRNGHIACLGLIMFDEMLFLESAGWQLMNTFSHKVQETPIQRQNKYKTWFVFQYFLPNNIFDLWNSGKKTKNLDSKSFFFMLYLHLYLFFLILLLVSFIFYLFYQTWSSR